MEGHHLIEVGLSLGSSMRIRCSCGRSDASECPILVKLRARAAEGDKESSLA